MSYNIPGIGTVPSDEPILVTYTGTQTSTITKIGSGGTIYKYSGNPEGTFGPTFTIFARDIHLFNGPYSFAKLNQVPEPEPIVVQSLDVVEAAMATQTVYAEPGTVAIESKLATSMATVSYDPDDFTLLKWVGDAAAKKLIDAGFSYFEDIIDASPGELASVLGFSDSKVQAVQASAMALIEE